MATETEITRLLAFWEERRRHGEVLSAEELCREQPHLCGVVRQRLEILEALDRRQPTAQGSTVGGDRPAELAPFVSFVAPDAPVSVPPAAEPVPGYALVRRLGRGGFGEVWACTAPGGFLVALKMVALSARAGVVELRALEVIKNIRHPNLLATFGTWQQDGRLIIAMELADGTLADRLTQAVLRGQLGLPRGELLTHMAEAAKAIDFLNSPRHTIEDKSGVSVQHRDIKPQNLLLVGGGLKVGDFGLARMLERNIASHTGSLTPAYAAPEFFDGKTAHTSDQYSLAVTYCQLRGGLLPFRGNLAQLTAGHLYREPDLSMLPPEERPVVARALAKDPNRRWPNCQAFVEALTDPAAAALDLSTEVGHGARPGEVGRLEGNGRGLLCLAFSPDGATVLGGGKGRELVLWDAATGKVLRRMAGHTDAIRGLAFIGPTTFAVSGGDDGSVRVWDVTTGEMTRRLRPDPGKVTCVAVSADGTQQLHANAAGKVRWWRDDGPTDTLKGHVGRVCAVAFSPDGRYALAAGGGHAIRDQGYKLGVVKDCAMRLWDLAAGGAPRHLAGHSDQVNAVAFTPDGRHLLSAGSDGTVRLWGVAGGHELHCSQRHRAAVLALAVTPDGRHAVTAGADATLRVWRVPADGGELEELERFDDHTDTVRALAVSPDGRRAVSAADDGTVRVWRLPD